MGTQYLLASLCTPLWTTKQSISSVTRFLFSAAKDDLVNFFLRVTGILCYEFAVLGLELSCTSSFSFYIFGSIELTLLGFDASLIVKVLTTRLIPQQNQLSPLAVLAQD